MAQFYAEVQGNRGATSRTGSKDSGMWGSVRGWNAGVEVFASHQDGRDVFHVYATGGSGADVGTGRLIATVTDTAQGPETKTEED